MTEIKDFITENSDSKLADFHSNLIFTQYKIYGIKIPLLKQFSKTITPQQIELKNLCHEEILLFGFSASQSKSEDFQLENLQKILPWIDNWATCDCIVCSLKKLTGQKSYLFFTNLLRDVRPFYVRVGIIGLMRYFIKSNKIDDILINITEISQTDYYVKMAIAWFLAELCIFDFEKAYKYISSTQDKFIRNKAISKSRESLRVSDVNKAKLIDLRLR